MYLYSHLLYSISIFNTCCSVFSNRATAMLISLNNIGERVMLGKLKPMLSDWGRGVFLKNIDYLTLLSIFSLKYMHIVLLYYIPTSTE